MPTIIKTIFFKTAILLVLVNIQVIALAQSKSPKPEIRLVSASDAKMQIKAVQGLLQRNFPKVANRFTLQIIPQENGLDVFEVKNGPSGKISISGSSGVAISVGINWYMKHVCNRQISWCGSNLKMSKSDIKPVPNGRFRNVLPHKHVVYMNYCTLSYSMAWWDWERWQWEIDFMAMNGINMPLGMVGIEAVWYNSLIRVGLTDAEARQFLVGPAFFAWQWMQNIENHCGPLPKSWIESHIKLGQQILAREREFGMSPIQQGFSGHVPLILREKFPQAKIRQQPKWCNFPGVAQLDPLDPLFLKFGRIFLEEEAKLFGLGGYYAADPFHESDPPSDIPKEEIPNYLKSVGNTIHQLFEDIDPNGTWVMQSWSIRKDIATAVPKGKLLVVDLAGEKWQDTDGFWGHNFCVGQLHNFGSRINFHGDLPYITSNPFARAKKDFPQTAAGTGLFPEGIVQNPVFYDCYFDMIWRNEGVNLDEWLTEYVKRRYGVTDGAAKEAWMLLKDGPYKKGTNGVESSSMVAARPALNCKKSGPNEGFNVPYSKASLAQAWELLLSDKERCSKMEGYKFDLIDVGRQTLSNLAQEIHKDIASDFEKRDNEEFKKSTMLFIDLLTDIDVLCDTRAEYRFGDWLTKAKSWGTTTDEQALFDKNASMLVTKWGPEETPDIFDYSWREWSGLIRGFYIPRWKMFFDFLEEKLEKRETYSEQGLPQVYGRETWRANEFYSNLADWEEQWIRTPKSFTNNKLTDEIKVAGELFAKWKPVFDQKFK